MTRDDVLRRLRAARAGSEPIDHRVADLEERMAEVERVNLRLEQAELTTARALQEISGHWDAVYEAMRRAERIDADDELP